jgi:caffeoyl-CoA O-methyltransferase
MADKPKSFHLSPEIHEYIVAHGTPPDDVLRGLIEETSTLGGISMMQIAPEQGAFMTLFARAIGARRAIEVGTFTGYSSLCLARGLPDDGQLICCDISEEWTSIGRPYWEKAGVAHKIDLRIAPALETLKSLTDDGAYDLAFIDADKPGYASYFEELMRLLRPGGTILCDNVLWSGNVINPQADDANTRAIRAFNDLVAADDRVDTAMLAVSDGLTLLRKR